MKKILSAATNYSKYCARGKKVLEDAGYEVVENPHQRSYTQEELLEVIGDVEGVVAGLEKYDETVFQHAPNLKVMARFGVGVENFDLKAAEKYGVTACNTPGINSSAVAEQAVALLLSFTRNVLRLDAALRQGQWVRPMAHELKSRTVGMLGFGAIARELAKRLRGFGCRMIAYDKYPNEAAAKELGVELVTMEDVLRESHIISLHLPVLPDTVHIINDETIRQMQDGVIIVNTARGAIADQAAIVRGIQSGKIAGFCADVFEGEPVTADNPLFALQETVVTPHVSAETFENCDETGIETARQILDTLAGKKPDHCLLWCGGK